MSYQQIILVGNAGSDPDLKYTAGGTAVCNFSLAVNRTWTQDGEKKQETTWFRVVCWKNLAETVNQYVTKGKQVMVVGDRIEASAYLSQKTNEPAASLEVTAQRVVFLGGKPDDSETDTTPF